MESDQSNGEQHMEELSVSFKYQFRLDANAHDLHHQQQEQQISDDDGASQKSEEAAAMAACKKSTSYSWLSGAALGANATLANTALGNGVLRQEILPGLDSPNSFRPLEKAQSLSRIESLMSFSSTSFPPEAASRSAPQRLESHSFLSSPNAQTAGGAAGEDRVQVVYSEEEGWLFCAIYDGFNGRDAADFLAGTLYGNVSHNLTQLVGQIQQEKSHSQEQQSQLAREEECVRKDASGTSTSGELQQQHLKEIRILAT